MNFDQLDNRIKDKLREEYRYSEVDSCSDWWDPVYEDAVRMGSLLGVTMGTKTRRTATNKIINYTDIHFSGFGSQGGGVAFTAGYECKFDAIATVAAEAPHDKDLLAIAEQLTATQIAHKLATGRTLSCNIHHSGNRNASFRITMAGEYDEECAEQPLLAAVKNFADWIYKQLEEAYDWLTSDEHLDEWLKEQTFDENGDII